MNNLRVALFIDTTEFAGTERYILDLGCALSDLGVSAMIACPTSSPLADRARTEGLKVIPIPNAGLINRPAVKMLAEMFRSGQLDIVHANNGRTSLASALAVRQARKGRFVATQHFLDPEHAGHTGVKSAIFHAAHKWVSRYMAHCVAISEAARAGVLRRGEAPEQKVTTILNGIRPLNPQKITPPALTRKELGIPPGTPLIVCAARLEREKDVQSLIAAMAEVKATLPEVRCVVAGQGAQWDMLTAQILEAGLQGTMQLLGFRKDAQALIQASDIFVLPSLAEPFGLVILEAMSLGRPVIATDAGGPREIVEQGVTGLLVPPSNPPALAAAIRKLLSDRQSTEAMGRRGQERFQAHFTAARMAQDMLAMYRRIL